MEKSRLMNKPIVFRITNKLKMEFFYASCLKLSIRNDYNL